MAHVRTQIRTTVADALINALPVSEYDIYSSRYFRRNRQVGRTLIDIRFLNVNVDQQTMGDERVHTGSLYIRAQTDDVEEKLDDLLDTHEVAITAAIEGIEWGDLVEESPELVQVNFSADTEGETAVGAIILRYDVEYRILKSDPESAVR